MQITSGNNSYGERKIIKRVLQDEDELNARIFQFPTSAVKDQGRKIHYYDFLMSKKSEDCNKALMRIVPRIHMDELSTRSSLLIGSATHILSDLYTSKMGKAPDARL